MRFFKHLKSDLGPEFIVVTPDDSNKWLAQLEYKDGEYKLIWLQEGIYLTSKQLKIIAKYLKILNTKD